jgi:arylsulfatase
LADERPNLVLILVDQWRADCLGLAGHPVVETPHLDRLFQGGTRFDRAYSAVPTCIAARAALMTGLHQRHHGRIGYQDAVPWRYDVTLPGLLSAGGYQTHCVGKMHVHPARQRLGFHEVVLHDGYLHVERDRSLDMERWDDYLVWLRERAGSEVDTIDRGIGCNGYAVRPWDLAESLHPSSWVVTQSIEFLRRRDPTRPFFLNLSFHRPHPPLDPLPYYLDMYRRKELPPVVTGDWVDTEARLPLNLLDSPAPTHPDQIHRARCAYFAMLSHIDTELNRLVLALTEHRLIANTAFLFCADHGEMLYDHNLVAKAVPYEASARVPFLLRLPHSWRERATPTTSAPIELRDVLPTLCELGDVAIPDTIDGQSVLPLARGEATHWRDHIHGEHYLPDRDGLDLANHWLTDGHEKYLWFPQSGRQQLFDLDRDPQELFELSGERPERIEHWRSVLASELEGREEGFVKNGELQAGRPQKAILSEVFDR